MAERRNGGLLTHLMREQLREMAEWWNGGDIFVRDIFKKTKLGETFLSDPFLRIHFRCHACLFSLNDDDDDVDDGDDDDDEDNYNDDDDEEDNYNDDDGDDDVGSMFIFEGH